MKLMGLQQQPLIRQPPAQFYPPSDYSFYQLSRPSSELSQYGAKPNFNNRLSTKQTLVFTNTNHNSKRNLATASSTNFSGAPTRSTTAASFQPFQSKPHPQTQTNNRINRGPYYQSKDQIINGLCYYHCIPRRNVRAPPYLQHYYV